MYIKTSILQILNSELLGSETKKKQKKKGTLCLHYNPQNKLLVSQYLSVKTSEYTEN